MKTLKFASSFLARLSIVLLVAQTGFAANTQPKTDLSVRLEKIVQGAGFKDKQLGLWVATNSNGKLEAQFSKNSGEQLIPASLSKIVTAGAVVHQLHPTFKYKTQLVSDAKVKDGILAGSLYLKGGGDPSFVSENMWFLVNEFTRNGITQIDGDVIVDDALFDNVRIGQDRESVRVDRAYDAPLGAMSMNWNSVNIYIRPASKAGEQAKVFVDPETPYLRVINETKTVAAGRGKTIAVERTSQKGFEGDVIQVNGAIATDVPEVVFYKSITNPDMYCGHNLVSFLRQRGISVKGSVKKGVAPGSADVLATAESKPLAQILGDMMKWSNNYVAEMLVKGLAAENGVKPATMAAGMQQLEKYLDSIGLKKGTYSFVNASGFSRVNRLSPEQLGKVLESVRDNFTAFPEYLSALPIGGVDGTLKNRMKGTKAERWVRAKTGLLNGVVGLSGFAGSEDGTVRSFVFIYNGAGKEDQARALFDRLAAALVEK
jgi:serine-type D-Ala-D-Ala carboxypeptidase/endopeptidase (penicillin-binding protein 4)